MSSIRSLVALVMGILPLAALAQTEAEQNRILQQVIVTAQKRTSSLQDVPFSVAAVTEEQIRNSNSSSLAELARNISGLTMTDLGPGQSQLAIRGISAGQVVRDQPGVKEQVGVYLDESPISIALFTPDLELFDLARLEVLRGPQGTLFGAGSTAGTVRYITQQPQLAKFEGTGELSLTDGSKSEFGGGAKGVVNLPLGDKAALRAVGYYDELAGFMSATQPNLSVKKDVNGGSKSGGRLALLLQPNEALSVTPRIVYQKLDTDGFPRIDIYNILANPFTTTQPAVDPGERGQFTQLREGLEDDFTLGDLRIEYSFGPMVLTAISSYTHREVVVTRDATSLTGSVTFDVGGTPDEVRLSSPLIDSTRLNAFSQEIRLASLTTGPLDWLAGAFYQKINRRYGQDLPTPGYDAITNRLFGVVSADVGAPPDTPFFSDLRYKFKQWALFGEGTLHLTDQWALTAGGRYYDFNEDRVLTFAGFFSAPTLDLPGSTSSNGFTPRVILAYDANDNLKFTAQASRGFRLGGINDPLNLPLCSAQDVVTFGNRATWEDEKVWNYELGAKTRSADGRFVLNTAVFYTDIKNLQANTDAGSCSSRIVFNVPKARSVGAEVELFARPNENWDFGISATYVEAELRSTVTSTADGVTTPVDGLEEGNRLPTAPKFQAAASATYSWPWLSQKGFATFTVQHVGSSFTQLADQAPGFGTIAPGAFITYGDPTISSFTFNPELPEYDIGNLRFGLRADQWEVAAFVNNLWDERAFLSVDRERGKRARVGYLTNPPRTYGVTIRRSF